MVGVAVGVSLLLAGCGSTDEDGASGSASASVAAAALPSTPMSADDAAKLDAAIAATYSPEVAKDFPGLWVGVWDPELGSYVKAWGDAVVGGAGASVDDAFRIGSVTKTMTATVVLQLVDEGTLSLDATVGSAAPKVAQAHPQVADLTIRQLLSMTSGLADYLNVPDGIVAQITKAPQTVWSADQLIDGGVQAGVQPPGTGGYSTTNYIVLQEVVEELTGTALGDLYAQRLTGPLQMADTALPPNDDTALPEQSAHGYLNQTCVDELQADGGSAQVGQDTTGWNASYGQGGGGVTSTITDLGRWGATGLGSSLLSAQTAAERAATKPVQDGLNYGLGIENYGDGFLGHSGEAFGWQTQVVHNPQTGMTVAMATNACAAADLFLFDSIRSLVGFTFYPPTIPPSPGVASPAANQ